MKQRKVRIMNIDEIMETISKLNKCKRQDMPATYNMAIDRAVRLLELKIGMGLGNKKGEKK